MKGIYEKPEAIKAIVEGRKTQTRRVIKPQPVHVEVCYGEATLYKDADNEIKWKYQVGEAVYVKEAFVIEQSEGFDEPKDRPFKNDYEWGLLIPHYKLTDPDPELYDDDGSRVSWRSPLFMPEWAARHFIVIESVRAERLQEIEVNDIKAEGVLPLYTHHNAHYRNGSAIPSSEFLNYRTPFLTLWNSINKDYPFESNPWVEVDTFRLRQEMPIEQ